MLIKEGRTNWKYILIVVILAVIVGGGILWLARKQEAPPSQFPEIKKPEKMVEIPRKLAFFNNGTGTFWVLDEDDLNMQNLNVPRSYYYSLSPSGKWLVFVKDNDIWNMDLISSELHRLTFQGRGWTEEYSAVYPMEPKWSSDGRFVAYRLVAAGGMGEEIPPPDVQYGLYIIDLENQKEPSLAKETKPYETFLFYWVPDTYEIILVDLDGASNRIVNVETLQEKDFFVSNGQFFSWDKEGKKFIYSKLSEGLKRDELWFFDGSDSTLLASASLGFMSWEQLSPDGKEIVYSFTNPFTEKFTGKDGIYILNVSTQKRQKIADGSRPFWLSDSERILFHKSRTGEKVGIYDLYIVKKDGLGLIMVAENSVFRDSSYE